MYQQSRRCQWDQIEDRGQSVPQTIIQSQGMQSNFFLSVRKFGGYKAIIVTQNTFLLVEHDLFSISQKAIKQNSLYDV